MSTTETTTQTLTPDQIPFTTPDVMRHFVTDTGKILPRRVTGVSAKLHRKITNAIKQSRAINLLP